MSEKFTIVVDTREQKPWVFEESDVCVGTESRGLPTGDYSLCGLESVFTIERKGSTGELAGNLFQKRFENELARMRSFRWAFILCEFTVEDLLAFPARSGIPPLRQKRMRMRGPYLLKRLCELWLAHGIPFLLVGKSAQPLALSLMKRAWESTRTTDEPHQPDD